MRQNSRLIRKVLILEGQIIPARRVAAAPGNGNTRWGRLAWFHSRLAASDRAAALLEEAKPFAAQSGGERLRERIDHQQGMQLYLQTRYRAARPLSVAH
ncbi:MAG: hypothetical protein EOM24_09150 [Chloroflexia bacterium]|nr:hypothetical protein [Chloroflexia bacterium]